MHRFAIGLLIALLWACDDGSVLPPDSDRLSMGTWGGSNAGILVGDTVTHVHVGCTNGYFPGPIALDARGRFSVAGSYILRAYPIVLGPPLPAQLSGLAQSNKLHLTVTVNDTVEKKVVVLGPVTVTFGQEPRMQQCPICRKPD